MRKDLFKQWLTEQAHARGVTYSSETECPVEVLELPVWRLLPTRKMLFGRFCQQCFAHKYDPAQFSFWFDLHSTTKRLNWYEAKRPTAENCVFNFYLVTRFGWRWVGLKAKIVET